MSLIFYLLGCLVTICVGVYTYIKWRFEYWQTQGIPYIKPKFPFGTLGNPILRKLPLAQVLQENYNYFKSIDSKHGGIYTTVRPVYLPVHPDSVKAIMLKDFNHFMNRGVYYNEKDDPLSAHLFNIEGQKWRKLRVKLTPTFTSGKMKMMFPILVICGKQLVAAIENLATNKKPIDIKEVLACFSTDVIGSCAFGLDCNSFGNKESEFRKYGRLFFKPVSRCKAIRNILAFASPTLGRRLGISITPKEVRDFFLGVVKNTVEFREKSNFVRNDFLQILINLKNNPCEIAETQEKKNRMQNLTIEEMAAQAFVFFIAGFETSSTTMTFCLFELAQNQEIQDKTRREVAQIIKNNNGELTYDAIMQMRYLSQVVDETLRKYPPVPIIPRICVKDYKIPDTNATIKAGVRVFIPAFALQRDPDFFSNPEKFDPDRFDNINKSKIVPFSYIPFGEGPRNCIGTRFGLMQTKTGLAVLLQKFRFTLNKKTTVPVEFNKFSFVLLAKDGIWLNVEKVV